MRIVARTLTMPRKYRKNQDVDQNSQGNQNPGPRVNWTEPMVHAALEEAIQQDALKKRAGQGFKAEAILAITAAAQEKADPEVGIKLTTSQMETKLDTVRSFLMPLEYILIIIHNCPPQY